MVSTEGLNRGSQIKFANEKIGFMPPPFSTETDRIRKKELNAHAAIAFAFDLNCLGKNNPPNLNSEAPDFPDIYESEQKDEKNGAIWFTRFTNDPASADLGLILTDISQSRIEVDGSSRPVIRRIGFETRKIALAQRTGYFIKNQNSETHNLISAYENGAKQIPDRPIRQHAAVEKALEIKRTIWVRLILALGRFSPSALHSAAIADFQALSTVALEEIGYKKLSSLAETSRKKIDLFNQIGKYPRRVIMGGSMPPAFGGADALATMAVGQMCAFIPRNSLFVDVNRQVALAEAARNKIDKLDIPTLWKERARRNIGASLGIDNPEESLKTAEKLYDSGIRLFRIYTIGADPRMVETIRLLRQRFGDEIEIFAGQIPDRKLALQLIAPDIRVDALIFGHGGGRQCTSAENGMAVTTLEEIYQTVTDKRFAKTAILVEGGAGRNVGTLLILGVDGVLFNGRLTHGTVESPAGDIFFKEKHTQKFVQPYPGSASAETQLIEAAFSEKLRQRRMNDAGRIQSEGSPGFTIFERKAGGSMVFWINGLLEDAARAMADLGVCDITELRKLISNQKIDVLRYVSSVARVIGSAYKNGK